MWPGLKGPPAASAAPDSGLTDSNPDDSSVHIGSTWQSQRPAQQHVDLQTAPLQCHAVALQTASRESQSSQTLEEGSANRKQDAADAKGVGRFLTRVAPLMLHELDQSFRYADMFAAAEAATTSSADRQVAPECRLTLKAFERDAVGKKSLVATSVSWSATGQTLAVAYGRYDIVGWCTLPGALATWHVGRDDISPSKPDVKIATSTCLMSCAFHPKHPALVAGGTFNGDLYIWDLGRESDMQVGRSDTASPVLHLEPIVAIHWQHSTSEASRHSSKVHAYRLVTLGADGRILVWLWHKVQSPVYGYELLHAGRGVDRPVIWGGRCMAFERSAHSEAAATFVAGTEGGRLFKCTLEFSELQSKEFLQKVVGGAADRVELRSPIKDVLAAEAHAGAVNAADCSPYQRELLLTAGMDGMVQLRHTLKPQPLLTLQPSSKAVHAVQWSPFRPLVFAAAAGDGRVYFYDLSRLHAVPCPVLALDASPDHDPTYSMAFNYKEPQLFATGTADSVKVWKLPSSLTQSRQNEAAVAKTLVLADSWEEVAAQ